MQVRHIASQTNLAIVIKSVSPEDFKFITKSRYFFDWKTERSKWVYKLCLEEMNDILGLISISNIKAEKRLEINLLAVSKENRGKGKTYEGIAGNLIAYACREALRLYGIQGCVSLIPKDIIKKHYMKKYGMCDAGRQIFLEGMSLFKALSDYEV
jgi:hypothetical protein